MNKERKRKKETGQNHQFDSNDLNKHEQQRVEPYFHQFHYHSFHLDHILIHD